MGDSELLYPMVINTYFAESAQMAEAAEYQDIKRTLRQKWGYGGQYATFDAFETECIKTCEVV